MSKAFIDPELARVGLDSGALTLLGAVVHRFEEPGDYRGTVRRAEAIERVFYLTVDKESPVAAADIDLAALAGNVSLPDGCCPDGQEPRYSVNPRGFAVFRVSAGSGGYSVNLRRADPGENTPVFNSARLDGGAIFTARLLRPGRYAVTNALSDARAEASVAPPPKAFSGYRPPEPLRVEVDEGGFRPERIALQPAQGLIFECRVPARIVITLEKGEDSPHDGDRRTA